jgi:hypothetical protein
VGALSADDEPTEESTGACLAGVEEPAEGASADVAADAVSLVVAAAYEEPPTYPKRFVPLYTVWWVPLPNRCFAPVARVADRVAAVVH